MSLAALVLAGCSTGQEALETSPTASRSTAVDWPAVPGRVLETSSPAGERVVRIAVDDPEQAYARARSLLVDAGFMLTKDRPQFGRR